MPKGGPRPGSGRKTNAERALRAQMAQEPQEPSLAQMIAEADRTPAAEPLPLGALDKMDPVQFLLAVMRGQTIATQDQIRAAIAAAQYTNRKLHDGGTKEAQQKKAEELSGKFSGAAPPKLAIVK